MFFFNGSQIRPILCAVFFALNFSCIRFVGQPVFWQCVMSGIQMHCQQFFFFILQPIIISSSASLPLVTSFWQKEVCLMVFMFFKKWVERVFGNNPTIRYYYLYLVLSLDLCFIIFVILFCWVIISSSISVWQSIIYVQLFYLNLMPI